MSGPPVDCWGPTGPVGRAVSYCSIDETPDLNLNGLAAVVALVAIAFVIDLAHEFRNRRWP